MHCPSCGSDMVSEDFGGLQIDVCQKCSGIWFDEGELGTFLRANPTAHPDFEETPTAQPENVAHLSRLCPKCQVGMESYKYAYTSPVQLDSCPMCHGVFVDQDEVAQIENYLAKSSQPDSREKLALATAQLEEGAQRSKQRATQIARSVWTRRMTGSYAWWMLGLDNVF